MGNKNQFVELMNKAIKDLYVEILDVAEDIFLADIGVNKDKWARFRGRVLDKGNDTIRLLNSLSDHCVIRPKRVRTVYQAIGDKLVEVDKREL